MTDGQERAAKRSKGAAHRVHYRSLRSGGGQGRDALSREGRHAV